MTQRYIDVLSEEERELEARIEALKAEAEALERKIEKEKELLCRHQRKVDEAQAKVDEKQEELRELNERVLGVKEEPTLNRDMMEKIIKEWHLKKGYQYDPGDDSYKAYLADELFSKFCIDNKGALVPQPKTEQVSWTQIAGVTPARGQVVTDDTT